MSAAVLPKTQKARKEIAKGLISACAIGQEIPEEDASTLAALVGDPEGTRYRRVRNPTYPTDPRCVERLGDDAGIFSWNHAIRRTWAQEKGKTYNPGRERVLKALRASVAHDLRDFLEGAGEFGCELCGSLDDPTADHNPPFRTIAEEFLSTRQVEVKNLRDGAGDVIASEALEAEWVAFHAARATYQVLCRSCNSSKGAR